MSLQRVTKKHPCKACGRGDWCMVGKDDYLCMRVQSNRPHQLSDGSVGWWHPLEKSAESFPLYKPECKERPKLDVVSKLMEWHKPNNDLELEALGNALGVSYESLYVLRCMRHPKPGTYAFPMCDGDGRYIGIRLRSMDGQKWAETGSRNGLFIPRIQPHHRMLVCEGPTDTAAAITLGCYAIGRPSCNGAADMIVKFITLNKVKEVVLVVDNDEPGIRGAQLLQKELKVRSCILICPAKDLREFVQNGGSRNILESLTKTLVWRHE
jgi:5S rRNA maturation endonuclease (ribonuclease M5)